MRDALLSELRDGQLKLEESSLNTAVNSKPIMPAAPARGLAA
jgi:hypothetical protein